MVSGGEGEVDIFAAQYFRDVSAGDRCAPTPCTLFIKCVQHSITTTNHAVINSDASSTPTLCTLFIKCVQRGAAELCGAGLVRGGSHAAGRGGA